MLRSTMHLAFFELRPSGVWVMASYSWLTFIPWRMSDRELRFFAHLVALTQPAGMWAIQVGFGFLQAKPVSLVVNLVNRSTQSLGNFFGWSFGIKASYCR